MLTERGLAAKPSNGGAAAAGVDYPLRSRNN
jgi:hypothetical protein